MAKRYSFSLKKYDLFLCANQNNKSGLKTVFTVCFLFLNLFLTFTLQAQDLIVKQDQSRIDARVIKVMPDAVQYKIAGATDNQVLSISKAEVYMIIYKNGRTEKFNSSEKPAESTNPSKSAKPAYTPPFRSETALSLDVEETSPQPTGKVIKNPTRLMLGAGVCPTEYEWIGAPKIAFEKVNVFGLPNFGIGLSGNLFIGFNQPFEFIDYYQTTMPGEIDFHKLYASIYVLKEFDTKIITFGLLAGPAANYTWGFLYLDVGGHGQGEFFTGTGRGEFFTSGLHTGQYLHKYLTTNKKGQRNLFMRLSFEQYVMLQGSYTHGLNLTFGL